MNTLSAFALISILVFIHEFGHFIVAKLCGVHCQILSIGYGKRLIGFEWRGTDYRISLLPFGGYVMMQGSDMFSGGRDDETEDVVVDESQGFMKQAVWKRILITLAGPVFNLLLPIVTFTMLMMHGEVQPAPVIGEVEWGTAAHNAGLLPNDKILQINGVETPSWAIVVKSIEDLPEGKYGMVIERQGERRNLRFRIKKDAHSDKGFGIQYLRQSAEIGVDDPKSPAGVAGLQTGDMITKINGQEIADYPELLLALNEKQSKLDVEYQRDEATLQASIQINPSWQSVGASEFSGLNLQWGIFPGTIFIGDISETIQVDESGFASMLGGTEEQSPAYLKGIKKGDRFSKIDGRAIHSWGDVLEAISESQEGEGEDATARLVKLELVRAGELRTIEVFPKIIRDTTLTGEYRYRPILGTSRAGGYSSGPTIKVAHSFGVAIEKATTETIAIAGFIVKQIKKLIVGEAAVHKNIGGPVEMVRQASEAAKAGWYTWVQLMSILSISLGIMNLMPLPVLDGGQLVFYILEAIRGKPLPLHWRERIQQIGVLFLVFLMLFVLVFDIERWLSGS